MIKENKDKSRKQHAHISFLFFSIFFFRHTFDTDEVGAHSEWSYDNIANNLQSLCAVRPDGRTDGRTDGRRSVQRPTGSPEKLAILWELGYFFQ